MATLSAKTNDAVHRVVARRKSSTPCHSRKQQLDATRRPGRRAMPGNAKHCNTPYAKPDCDTRFHGRVCQRRPGARVCPRNTPVADKLCRVCARPAVDVYSNTRRRMYECGPNNSLCLGLSATAQRIIISCSPGCLTDCRRNVCLLWLVHSRTKPHHPNTLQRRLSQTVIQRCVALPFAPPHRMSVTKRRTTHLMVHNIKQTRPRCGACKIVSVRLCMGGCVAMGT